MGTSIDDTDGVYDPRLYNDRLLLGLKGTVSEAELYLMRQRLNAGRLRKAQHGEYVQRLPPGLVCLADNRVVKDPDLQIQHVIELVFSKFEEVGSGYGVLRYCKPHDIFLPRRPGGDFGPGDVRWRKPSEDTADEVGDMGAFCWREHETSVASYDPNVPLIGKSISPHGSRKRIHGRSDRHCGPEW